MKKIIAIIFLVTCINKLNAQLHITTGAALTLTGNAQLTLSNIDFVNNGIFNAGSGTVTFTGDANATVSGNQPIQFYNLEVNKSGNSSVMLQSNIGISQQINFTNGFIDLNGFNADLGTTGALNNESENSRVTGANGGQLLFSTTLNAPSGANPGNLGAYITSSKNLGTTVIKRGHQSQMNGSGNGSSILRYFDIIPAANSGLDATLRMQYFIGELNNLDENTLAFLEKPG